MAQIYGFYHEFGNHTRYYYLKQSKYTKPQMNRMCSFPLDSIGGHFAFIYVHNNEHQIELLNVISLFGYEIQNNFPTIQTKFF